MMDNEISASLFECVTNEACRPLNTLHAFLEINNGNVYRVTS